MKPSYRILFFAVFSCAILLSCRTIPKGAKAVKPFDQKKYLGGWYEIARFDYKFEKNLNNVTANYSLNNDGTIRVNNRGFNYVKKLWKQSVGKAKSAGDPTEGKLRVSFFKPFYSAYNIIAIDSAYKYALVAGKSKRYLWILSRETSVPENLKDEYLNLARSIGYKTDGLIWVQHD
jgi:apolipoprotein D and lipocalin family protein